MEKLNDTEILSPAGSLKMARAVFAAGADAVYFGGENFSARAYADNFTKEEAKKLIELAHIHGKRVYLAVNTLLKNKEMEYMLYDELKFFYEQGIDACLVCDFGVLRLCREYFSDLPIHASTQMNITSSYGANYLSQLGVKRIVAARELSLEELSAIHRASDIDIEAFVHGALCYCYSGQCLLSSFMGGRSGNRGRCAQPCRLGYELYEGSERLSTDGDYLLSPKDFCAIGELDKLMAAGVKSFKIEGRRKTVEYAAEVTAIYRYYLDKLNSEGKEGYNVDEADLKRLYDAGNRDGFTDSYLFVKNSKEMMSMRDSSHHSAMQDIDISDMPKKSVDGYFYAHSGSECILSISTEDYEVSVSTGSICQQAKNTPTGEEEILSKLKKINDTPFIFKNIDIDISGDLFLPLKEVNHLKREALNKLKDKYLEEKRRTVKKPFKPLLFKASDNITERRVHTYIRVRTREQLDVFKDKDGIKLIIPPQLYDEKLLSDKDAVIICIFPVIRSHNADYIKGFIKEHTQLCYEASSYDALGLLEDFGIPKNKIILGEHLYTLSERTRLNFMDEGYRLTTSSGELSKNELAYRKNTKSKLMIYGREVLMYTANCMTNNTKGCDHKRSIYSLKDRYNKYFPIECDCENCTNVLYNSQCTYLLGEYDNLTKMGFYNFELDFTIETGDECKKIYDEYTNVLVGKSLNTIPEGYTSGHYRKGIA